MYKVIAIAGTFDRLHKGHRFFISQAFRSGEKVIIGLTSDEYVKEKSNPPAGGQNPKIQINPKIQNYQTRLGELKQFLQKKGLADRAEIVKIDDVYGSAVDRIKGKEIEALVITSETLAGGQVVNKRRKKLGLKLLELLKVSMIKAEDRKRIASTRIRLGEIDRWGRVYGNIKYQISNIKYQNKKDRYKISEGLRQELKKPQGTLIKGNPENHRQLTFELKKIVNKLKPVMIIACGDEVTKLSNQTGLPINLAMVDFKVKRQPVYRSFAEIGFDIESDIKVSNIVIVRNPAGSISRTLVTAVKKSIKSWISDGRRRIIKVIGEEDLAGVPAILLSPLGSVVIYGQPEVGLVVVPITEEKKQTLFNLIQRYNR